MKYFQNRIAESNLTLPVMAVYAVAVWLLSGLVTDQWWGQFTCFVVSTYLLIELSNSNALLRVRSRMVSSTFLALSCAACFLFSSLSGGIVLLCLIAAISILFRTYQDKQSPGWAFYSFLCLGLSTLVFPQMFFFVPVLWVLMVTQLQSLSWRSWLASVVGLLTPYWFGLFWFVYRQDLTPIVEHFEQLTQFTAIDNQGEPVGYVQQLQLLTFGQVAVFVLTLILVLTSIAHFWHRSFEDKIRIRLLYGFLITICLLSVVFLILQPHHYDFLMRIIIVTASPLIAHFFTFTHSRATNMMFCTSCVLALILMVFNLIVMLTPDLLHVIPLSPWSGS